MLLGHLVVCLVTPLLQAAPLSPKNVKVYTTAKDTNKRLTLTQESTFKPGKQATEGEISIFVNPNKRFQKVLGIGGAITDASAEVFAKLPADKQSEMLKDRISLADMMRDYVGTFYSKEYIRRHILRQSEREMEDIDSQIEKEKADNPQQEIGDTDERTS